MAAGGLPHQRQPIRIDPEFTRMGFHIPDGLLHILGSRRVPVFRSEPVIDAEPRQPTAIQHREQGLINAACLSPPDQPPPCTRITAAKGPGPCRDVGVHHQDFARNSRILDIVPDFDAGSRPGIAHEQSPKTSNRMLCYRYARISFTTRPYTSVNRKSRPL